MYSSNCVAKSSALFSFKYFQYLQTQNFTKFKDFVEPYSAATFCQYQAIIYLKD